MKPVAEAARLVLEQIAELRRPGAELVPLRAARGRVLADDVISSRALPGFDNSAMDGYAARAGELPATLPIALTVAAGAGAPPDLPAGAVARILTGAPIPPGADTAVIQEDATVEGADDAAAAVTLPASEVGANIRHAGEDIALGERAISAGARLGAGELGVLAALGVTEVLVARAPRVALIATGDELVDVAAALGPGQLVDSSAHALGAMIADAGGAFDYIGIGRDDPMTLAAMIASAIADHDLVLTTGGVSVGDRDHVRAALAAAGVSLELWKVAMRPGKPFSFGHDGRVPVFGLPGNPVSTVVAFELFVRPALLAMQGVPAAAIERPRAPVALARGYRKSAGRAHYLRAHVVRNGEHLVAHPHAKQGSAMLSSLVGCNALVEIAADETEIAQGALVPALLLEAV